MSYGQWNLAQWLAMCCMSQAQADSTSRSVSLRELFHPSVWEMQKWAPTLIPLLSFVLLAGRVWDGHLCPSAHHQQQHNLRKVKPEGKVITFRKTQSKMLHFRTYILHYLHPSLQSCYNVWHNSKSFWKSEYNCQLKLILGHINKELVTYTDVSNVYRLLENIYNFSLLFSPSQKNIALSRVLVYDYFSRVPAVCEMHLLREYWIALCLL